MNRSALVINCGSTSIKVAVLKHNSSERLAELRVQRLQTPEAAFGLTDGGGNVLSSGSCPASHEDALKQCLPALFDQLGDVGVQCVGHRVVHGGSDFTEPVLVNDEVLAALRDTIPLAPLHNPANLAGIEVARACMPQVPHVAVFDTAFHSTIPRRAYSYALPQSLANKHQIRRFGFHGTSHKRVASLAGRYLDEDLRQLRLITCHLGGGCSVCAVEYGRSVETSMGMTPLEGLVMGTRSGDIDPGAVLQLARLENWSLDEIDETLNRKSGLAGLSGIGNDLRDIESKAEEGDENCRLAIQVFCHRLRKYIGAYAAVMGGVDAIVFTAGIGQNSAVIRHRVAQRLDFLGARLDEDLNRDAKVDAAAPVVEVSASRSRTRLLVVRTDEAAQIAEEAVELTKRLEVNPIAKSIPVGISARHVHLTQETVETLFGKGHQLTPLKPLSQPGQFAAEECVTLVGPKRSIPGVRVLGPTRSKDQVEIARTDEFFLGIDAPIRASGDVANSPGITLVGTEDRQVTIDCGVICAWRHIHMTPEDAEAFGVEDRDVVSVEVGDPGVRSLTFNDVLVRVKSSYKLEMHIDTDEGNAAELDRVDSGVLEKEGMQLIGAASNLKKK